MSPTTVTVIVFVVSPGLKASMPLAAVKSVPAVAVPAVVAYETETGSRLDADRVTGKDRVVDTFPSGAVTPWIEMDGFGNVAIGNLETFVADPPDAVTVSRTDSTFPLAVAGTISDSRATPALRIRVRDQLPGNDQVRDHLRAGRVDHLVRDGESAVQGIAFAGTATGFPITGLPTVEAIGVPLAAAASAGHDEDQRPEGG